MFSSKLPIVIGICGMRRSGKDTISSFFSNYGYKNVKISKPLKTVCQTIFGFSESQMEDETKDIIDENLGISPRKALQFFGTEVMQYKIQELLPNVGRTFWIDMLIRQNVEEKIVISDMRFQHEYNALKTKYGNNLFIIKVTRDHNIGKDIHLSENEWMHIKEDFLIENNKTIDDLHKQIAKLIEIYGM